MLRGRLWLDIRGPGLDRSMGGSYGQRGTEAQVKTVEIQRGREKQLTCRVVT